MYVRSAQLNRVKLGGESPSAANISALKTGAETVWTGFPIAILGWRILDMAARDSVGDPLTEAEATPQTEVDMEVEKVLETAKQDKVALPKRK